MNLHEDSTHSDHQVSSPPKRLRPDSRGPIDSAVARQYGPFVFYLLVTIGGMFPAMPYSSMDLASYAWCLGFLANMSLILAWLARPLGQKLPLYLATVVPAVTLFVFFKYPAYDGLSPPPIQVTSLPLLLVVTLIPFLFIQIATKKKLVFSNTNDLSEKEQSEVDSSQISIAQIMGFTLAAGFAFAVFTSGEHEKNGIAWELVPILGVGVGAMLYAVLADLALTLNKPVTIMVAVSVILALTQSLLARSGLHSNHYFAATFILPISLFGPLIVLRWTGGRWESTLVTPTPPPQPKRPIQRLD